MRNKNNRFKEWLLDRIFSLKPIGELCITVGITFLYVVGFIYIVLYGHHLDLFFVPVLILYILPTFFIKYFIEKRDARNQIQAMGGDTLYADLYPKEAAKIERKRQKAKEKAARKAEKEAEKRAASYTEEKPKKPKKSKDRDYRGPEF